MWISYINQPLIHGHFVALGTGTLSRNPIVRTDSLPIGGTRDPVDDRETERACRMPRCSLRARGGSSPCSPCSPKGCAWLCAAPVPASGRPCPPLRAVADAGASGQGASRLSTRCAFQAPRVEQGAVRRGRRRAGEGEGFPGYPTAPESRWRPFRRPGNGMWEREAERAYARPMDDIDAPDDVPRPPPAVWLEALDRSEADLAAGRTMPWRKVRTRLLATPAEQARRRA